MTLKIEDVLPQIDRTEESTQNESDEEEPDESGLACLASTVFENGGEFSSVLLHSPEDQHYMGNLLANCFTTHTH